AGGVAAGVPVRLRRGREPYGKHGRLCTGGRGRGGPAYYPGGQPAAGSDVSDDAVYGGGGSGAALTGPAAKRGKGHCAAAALCRGRATRRGLRAGCVRDRTSAREQRGDGRARAYSPAR